ncbi:hypothetical protein CNR22_21720 [Sphingobacteriaceae bacterium]|nr:hypothetical protein CNR22_21720 [Sphingobacteriaceae bacterium]
MSIKKDTMRLILAVIAGIITAMLLSGLTHELLYLLFDYPAPLKPMFEAGPLWIALFYHSIYAVIGAMITARIAKERAKKAVFILGTKEAIMWLLGTILLWKHAAPWYNITKAILGIPLALLGGWIYSYFQRKRNLPNTFKL